MDKTEVITQVKKALELTKEKDYNSAGKIYTELLKHDKNNPTILSLLGLLYLNIGKLKLAKKTLLKANKLNPNNSTTLEALGFTMYNIGEFANACEYFNSIINLSKNFEVYEKYINALIELRNYKQAYDIGIQGIKKFPLNKEILTALVQASIFSGNLNDAIKYSQTLLSAYPKYAQSWLKQGLIQEVIFHDEKSAQKCYKMAIKYGNKTSAYYNLAISYNKIKEYKKAAYYINKIIKSDGLNSNNSFILATINFCQRKIKQGYKYYSKKDELRVGNPKIPNLKNLWDGKTYKNEVLHVYCDQGIGDNIMFSRYFPALESKFNEIKITTYPTLLKIFKRSFKQYKKLKFYQRSSRLPKSDKSAIMSNLPYTLKMETEFPFSEGYMIADENLTKEFKETFFNTEKLKVGICWEAGAAGIREQLNRTLHISIFEDILKLKNIQYYSLQHKPTLEDYKNYQNIIDLGTRFKDFDETAAAIKNLDVVITVDTSVAHIAGALGIKTFLLLPYCTDWRWFDDTKTTPWYNSVTLFKQSEFVFWDKEIADIKHELKKML